MAGTVMEAARLIKTISKVIKLKEVKNMVDLIPGYDITNLGSILPGGAPFVVREPGVQGWQYSHTANGVDFYFSPMTGHYGCFKKNGQWKQWKPYRPVVFGKKTDAAKLARVLKKHRKVWKELNKVFGKKTRRRSTRSTRGGTQNIKISVDD